MSNDVCSDAILLEVNDACSYAMFNNTGASDELLGIPAPGCAGTIYKDIWCKFVVPAGGHIEISTQSGSVNDMAMAIYSGSCGSLTLIECDDDTYAAMPIINRAGLTPGETIFIRLWEYGGNAEGTFGICISIPAPLAPDECANATELTVGSICEYYVFDNTGCTESSGVSDPDCGTSNYYYDVWFKCEIPASGNVRISTDLIEGSNLTDCAMAVYTGTCGSLTQIACNNDYVYGMERMPFIDLYDRTPGEMIYIRFWDLVTSGKSSAKDEGVCKICTYELLDLLACIPSTLPEDLCENAPLIASLDGYCGNTSSTYNPENPGNLSSLFCGSIENNSWLSFIASSETAQLNVYVSDCYSSSNSWAYPTSGIQMAVYGTSDCIVFSTYSSCWFPGEPVDGFITATGLTAGETYILMMDGVYGDNCDYKIGAAEGSILLPVEFISAGATCKGDKVEVYWQTASEKNCDYFSVEKSYDAINFVPIMSVPGAGNSAGKSDYYYDDYEVSDVRTYYRIKQTDFDGKFSYSKLFTVNCFEYKKSDISIYPNPFNNSFCVDFASCEKQPVKIEICSLSGSLLQSRIVESNEKTQECFSMDDSFAPGYFLLKVFFDDDIQVLKLVKI